ncbi:MAG TPA: hypothetical protein VE967_18390, partial [Gemmatimonadaceae bacterium]|nr:hypothetical protein [Gemmatimonadaceae bacterium]
MSRPAASGHVNVRARRIVLLLVLTLAARADSCRQVFSVFPLFTDRDLVADPRIGGFWTDAESHNAWGVLP